MEWLKVRHSPWWLVLALVNAGIAALFVMVLPHPYNQFFMFFAGCVVACLLGFFKWEPSAPTVNPHGMRVQDIIKAYRVEPAREWPRSHYVGNNLILAGLIGFGVLLFMIALGDGSFNPAIFGVISICAAVAYWYFQGGSYLFAKPISLAEPVKPLTRPPTLQDTQLAQNYMRIAFQGIQKFYNQGAERPDMLVIALIEPSNFLNKARSLDPGASISIPEEQVTYTLDMLAGQLLYIEAWAYAEMARTIQFQNAPDLFGNTDPVGSLRAFEERRQQKLAEYHPKALFAAEKAVLYQPNNTEYLRMLARCYEANDMPEPAKAVLNIALRINPNDLETLRLLS